MKALRGVLLSLLFTCALIPALGAAATSARAALGTSAAIDPQGRVWITYARASGELSEVVASRFDAPSSTWTSPRIVNAKAEAVASDGENRPKLAFGPRGELFVTWTTPTSDKYTGDIRFSASSDEGQTWSAPTTVHRDRQLITHRFESLIVDREGRIWVVWIDKRDLHAAERDQREYAGAAIYYAYSTDGGVSWNGDFKLADHSCECCRIALSLDTRGDPIAFWRHVFAGSERDHAFARLQLKPQDVRTVRATRDRWRIDACPHHGPSLSIDAAGTAHAVWFNQVGGQGRVFYGQLTNDGPQRVTALPLGAMHADVAGAGTDVAIAWKRFDGERTRIETWVSSDRGRTFTPGPQLHSDSSSDQPRLVSDGARIYLVWRQSDRVALVDVLSRATDTEAASQPRSTPADIRSAAVRPFTKHTRPEIEKQRRGRSFWLVLWDLECTYCMKSLANIAQLQRTGSDLEIVTIATDPLDLAPQLQERLSKIGIVSEAYAFADAPVEALRHAIDPTWMGEKPRAYRYDANGGRVAISGVLDKARLEDRADPADRDQ